MTFVLDASVTACWAFRDVAHPVAVVPALWWFEVRSILNVNERRKRLTESNTASFLRDLSRLTVTVDHAPDEAQILCLARTRRLSVHDAAYLELAARRGLRQSGIRRTHLRLR